MVRCLLYFQLTVVIHTSMLFFQVVTLNVAVNSYSNALLSLLMSNQFVEIKATVFKKFEKENLFQMSCAGTYPHCQHLSDLDIIERFHLSLLLTLILLRNLIEHTNSLTKPLSLPWMDLCMPFIMVLGSELLVDWCKHAFVTKFNHIRPSVYGRFMDVLCLDFVKDGKEVSLPQTKVDNRPMSIRVRLSQEEWVFQPFHLFVLRCEQWDKRLRYSVRIIFLAKMSPPRLRLRLLLDLLMQHYDESYHWGMVLHGKYGLSRMDCW